MMSMPVVKADCWRGGELAGLIPKSSWAGSALGDTAKTVGRKISALERLLGSPSSLDRCTHALPPVLEFQVSWGLAGGGSAAK